MAEITQENRGGRIRITRSWVVRVLGSAAILGVTLWVLPTGGVLDGFRALEARLFVLVLVLFLAGHTVAACKWWLLIDRCVGFARALRAHFAGLAANLFLPGVAGGDAVRAGVLFKAVAPKERLVAGSLVDRLIDIVALALISGGGLLVLQDGGSGATGVLIRIAVLLVVILGGVFVVLPRLVPLVVNRFPGLPMRKLALKLADAFGQLAKSPGVLVAALSMSLMIQAGFVTLTIWLAEGIGTQAPIGAWFFAWPLAKILAVLPVSIGGLGVREATLAALLAPFGADPSAVVAASLIWQAVLFSAGLLGAAAWALSSGSRIENSSNDHIASSHDQ